MDEETGSSNPVWRQSQYGFEVSTMLAYEGIHRGINDRGEILSLGVRICQSKLQCP